MFLFNRSAHAASPRRWCAGLCFVLSFARVVVFLCVVWLVVELVVFSYFVLLICLYIFFISSLIFSRFFSSSLVVYSLVILFLFFSFGVFLNSLFDTFRCLWVFFLCLGASFGAIWSLLGSLLGVLGPLGTLSDASWRHLGL